MMAESGSIYSAPSSLTLSYQQPLGRCCPAPGRLFLDTQTHRARSAPWLPRLIRAEVININRAWTASMWRMPVRLLSTCTTAPRLPILARFSATQNYSPHITAGRKRPSPALNYFFLSIGQEACPAIQKILILNYSQKREKSFYRWNNRRGGSIARPHPGSRPLAVLFSFLLFATQQFDWVSWTIISENKKITEAPG